MPAGSPPGSLFGDLQWLSFFESDGARIAATTLVCITFVLIFCTRPIAEVWLKDRADKRAHTERKMALIAKVNQTLTQREVERLDLDA